MKLTDPQYRALKAIGEGHVGWRTDARDALIKPRGVNKRSIEALLSQGLARTSLGVIAITTRPIHLTSAGREALAARETAW